MQHFYDGQLRRYLTQLVRMFSGFSYQDGKGNLTTIPVMYGDITRQVGSILRDNSENKIPSAPRMGIYVTGLELDRNRLSDSSYVSKVNIRERAFDEAGNEYLNTSGKNYTVERLMPTPYTLTVSVDLWSTNTDQKLQILEQIMMLFNPSLEIQTTDNYLDWTSLSVVNLESITWSSRSIPTGTESEIDVATMSFTTPVFISPPVKVKRLGVVTDIINRVSGSVDELLEELGNGNSIAVEVGNTGGGKSNIRTGLAVTDTGAIERIKQDSDWQLGTSLLSIRKTAYQNTDLLVINNTLKLITRGILGAKTWPEFIEAFPDTFVDGVSTVVLGRADWPYDIIGTIAIDQTDPGQAIVNWDEDTLPTDTIITSALGARSKIDYIIDPTKSNPNKADSGTGEILKKVGNRILLLAPIGDPINTDGADGWKNNDGTDFIADANDIVEWDGSKWTIVFDASESEDSTTTYVTNLNTGVQYKYNQGEWLLSFEGEYPNGAWRIDF
jgi:hypothetical protein